jgi:hypothetical protein
MTRATARAVALSQQEERQVAVLAIGLALLGTMIILRPPAALPIKITLKKRRLPQRRD